MKLTRFIYPLRRSIFFKLLVTFLAAGLLILVSVIATAHYYSDPKRVVHEKFQKNIAKYATYLIAEIGLPPDTRVADKLANELSVDIKIEGPQFLWQSTEIDLPGREQMFVHTLESNPNVRVGHFPQHSFIAVKQQNYEYLFLISHQKFVENVWRFLVLLGLIVVSVVGGSYLIVRWLLRPLKWLDQGVSQLATGNFSYRVPERKHDELSDLARAFNIMSARISQTVASKEQLLLDVSHELRSPITRVKLALEFIPESKEKLGIVNDIREIEVMITELLESARLSNSEQMLHKTAFDIVPVIAMLVRQYEGRAPGLTILHLPPTLVTVADEDRVVIVLRNLIENALKYSAQQAKAVELELHEKHPGLEITVRDFGEGIPAEALSHVFEPFYRVDKSRQSRSGGYGLGLSLCEKIVAAHGGKIYAKSRPGIETIFTVFLPK